MFYEGKCGKDSRGAGAGNDNRLSLAHIGNRRLVTGVPRKGIIHKCFKINMYKDRRSPGIKRPPPDEDALQ